MQTQQSINVVQRQVRAQWPPHRPSGTPPRRRRNPPGYRAAIKERQRQAALREMQAERDLYGFLAAHNITRRMVEKAAHTKRMSRPRVIAELTSIIRKEYDDAMAH